MGLKLTYLQSTKIPVWVSAAEMVRVYSAQWLNGEHYLLAEPIVVL